jgi:hypothetical protein
MLDPIFYRTLFYDFRPVISPRELVNPFDKSQGQQAHFYVTRKLMFIEFFYLVVELDGLQYSTKSARFANLLASGIEIRKTACCTSTSDHTMSEKSTSIIHIGKSR